MTSFSPQMTEWLSRYHDFVNTGNLSASPDAGRSLGPASGNLWDCYPFMEPNEFTGLLAGLSLSGLESCEEQVALHQYLAKSGFQPISTGPFSGNLWQNLTGEDWIKMDPTIYSPRTDIPQPTHSVDLVFCIGTVFHKTMNWHYVERELSRNYILHTWWQPEQYVLTAVTYRTTWETRSPFLKPAFVEGNGIFDPACLFPSQTSPRLFRGLTVLTPGNNILLSVEENSQQEDSELPSDSGTVLTEKTDHVNVTITRIQPARSGIIRSILGVLPNGQGDMSLTSTGCHHLLRQVEEMDSESRLITLMPNTLFLRSKDQPCCSCDDYISAYERLRNLNLRQEKTILRYNDVFQRLRDLREQVQVIMAEHVHPIRLRLRSFQPLAGEDEPPLYQSDYVLIYTNVRDEQRDFEGLTLRLLPDDGSMRIRDVQMVNKRKCEDGFEILRFNWHELEVGPVVVPGLSHQGLRLRLLVEGDVHDTEPPYQLILISKQEEEEP